MMAGKCRVKLDELVDYAVGELDGERKARIEAHLREGCARCQRELAWLSRVGEVTHRAEGGKSRAWAVRQVACLLSPQSAKGRAPVLTRLLVERVRASLISDSLVATPVGQMRAAGVAEARQLLYTADDLDLDLRVEQNPRDGRLSLTGQILARDGSLEDVAGAEVRLVPVGNGPELGRITNGFGEFVFDRLPPDTYGLWIRAGRREVEVDGLDLQDLGVGRGRRLGTGGLSRGNRGLAW